MRRLLVLVVAGLALGALSQPAAADIRLKVGWFDPQAALDGGLAYGADVDLPIPMLNLYLSTDYTRSSTTQLVGSSLVTATARAWNLSVGKRFGAGALGLGVYAGAEVGLTNWTNTGDIPGVISSGSGNDLTLSGVAGIKARRYAIEGKYRLGDLPKAEQGFSLWVCYRL